MTVHTKTSAMMVMLTLLASGWATIIATTPPARADVIYQYTFFPSGFHVQFSDGSLPTITGSFSWDATTFGMTAVAITLATGVPGDNEGAMYNQIIPVPFVNAIDTIEAYDGGSKYLTIKFANFFSIADDPVGAIFWQNTATPRAANANPDGLGIRLVNAVGEPPTIGLVAAALACFVLTRRINRKVSLVEE